MERAAPQMDLPLLHWGLCVLHRQWWQWAFVFFSPGFCYSCWYTYCTLTAEFSKLNSTLSSFIYYLSTSLSDNVLISLSHAMIFTATKIKSFLMCYFDYCKRPETKQNGCSKCGVMKIKSSDGCLGVTGTLSCYCCEWRLVEKTLVLGWVWRCSPFQGCQRYEQGVGSSRVERRLVFSLGGSGHLQEGSQIVKKE